jgi:hypothetical protein
MTWLDDDLRQLEFEPVSEINLPPVRQRATYEAPYEQDGKRVGMVKIQFVVSANDTISDDLLGKFTSELRVACTVQDPIADELADSVEPQRQQTGSAVVEPAEPMVDTVEDQTSNFDDTLVITFAVDPVDRQMLPSAFDLQFDLDPTVAGTTRHVYSFGEITTQVTVNVICSEGEVRSTLTFAGPSQISPPDATLESGQRGPELTIRANQGSGRYRITGTRRIDFEGVPDMIIR